MNDSTVTTPKKKISKKAVKVAGKAKAAKVKPLAPKATKPKKPTAAELKAARKLLASQNPLAEAREILKAAKCTGIMIAAEGPGGFFSDADPMPPALCKLARASVRSAGERFELNALQPRAAALS